MKLSDFLDGVGHPVAYYPALAGPLGSVNAAVLFCQLYYWLKRSANELGVHKTVAELQFETGMSRAEQETARKALKKRGVLVETHRRIEHRLYYQLDVDILERLMDEHAAKHGSGEFSESENPASPNARNPLSRKRESSVRESGNPALPNAETSRSRFRKTRVREAVNPAFVNGVKTTAETTAAERVRETAPVDNSAAAAAAGSKSTATPKPDRESQIRALLAELTGKPCEPDSRDRVFVLAWIGDEATDDELREAYRRALDRRGRDRDDRPVYVAFLASFVREVLAERSTEAGGTREWWLGSETQVCNEGHRLGVRPKKPDEPLPAYRVLVAKAAGKGPWIDFVLMDAQRSNSERFMRFVTETLGEALLPVDWYAS